MEKQKLRKLLDEYKKVNVGEYFIVFPKKYDLLWGGLVQIGGALKIRGKTILIEENPGSFVWVFVDEVADLRFSVYPENAGVFTFRNEEENGVVGGFVAPGNVQALVQVERSDGYTDEMFTYCLTNGTAKKLFTGIEQIRDALELLQ